MAGGQFVGDGPGIRQRPGQPVQLGHHQGVAVPARRERLPPPRALPVGAGQSVVDVEAVGRYAQLVEVYMEGSRVVVGFVQ